ncbi:hypothetical protein AeMF1_004885 [Aphanomyces euteiches]|nr:hypothetical protein AeMF1_004885 [Aphanomyces euteiches]
MQVCIMIVGTHGDVAPFVGIGKRLQKDGHRVRLATHATYRSFVTKNGLEFYPLGGDPKELSAYMVKTSGHIVSFNYEILTKDTPRNLRMIDEILRSTWPAVSAPDPEGDPHLPPFRAHAIISNPVTYGHIHVAENLGVPLHIMFPQPWVPTQEFPHPLSNLPYKGKREKRNATSYHVVDALMWAGTEGLVNSFRQEVLGLTKIRMGDGGRSMLLDWKIPHSFMWSEHLVPCPSDWDPQLYDVIGTVTESVNTTSSYTPSDDFAAFLASGPAPIFVGFGSMVIPHPAKTTQTIIDAATEAQVRVVIQSSWSDMSNGGSIEIPDNLFILGNCPHDWLFPRMAAVVHHGGAGTTGAGLLAGKPTFIVPFFGDQPFWGWAVEHVKVGVRPCPLGDLTVKKLRQAFLQLLSPATIANAKAIQAKMQQENGIENAVQSFYRHLPKMNCAFTPEHVATKWLHDDKIQVCDGCAFVLRARTDQPIEDYHPVQYGIMGPLNALEGVSSGAGAFFHELSGAVKDIVAQPARGFKKDGLRGAGVGAIKGFGGLVVRPINGLAQFVTRVAVGAHNAADHGEDQRRVDEPTHWIKEFHVKRTAPMVDVSLSEEERAAVQAAIEDARAHKPLSVIRENTTHLSSLSSASTLRDEEDDDDDDESMPNYLHKTSHGTFMMGSPDANVQSKQRAAFARSYSSRMAVVEDDWEELTVPFSMSIAMLVVGLPSDVEAFVAIAKSLVRDGHRVRLAAARRFETFVKASGVEYVPLEGNPTTSQDRLSTLSHWEGIFHQEKPPNAPWNNDEAFGISAWRAVKSSDFRADLIVAHPDTMLHVHLAERLGVPLHLLSGIPYSPTADMPQPLVEVMAHEDQQSNWFSYLEVHRFVWNHFRHATNKFRVQELHLAPWNAKHAPAWWQWHIPISYYWSSLLLSKREDWGDEVDVVGFIQLDEDDSKYVPQPELAAFVAQHALHRVYISLPAMNQNMLISMTEVLLSSRSDIQVVIGQEDIMGGPMLLSDRLVIVDASISLKWVVEHCQVVIHQARDARLLAEILQQNKPSVAVPVTAIEKQWANHLREMDPDVHFPPVSLESLAGQPEMLADMVAKLVAAVEVDVLSFWSRHVVLETKQAIRRTVSSIYKHLPIEAMQCDIIPSKLARVYDPDLDLKLSYEAAYVANQLDADKVAKYAPVFYSLKDLPQVAVKAGRAPKRESAMDSLLMGSMPPVGPAFAYQESMTSLPIDTSLFWKTHSEEMAFRKRASDGYDKLHTTRAAATSKT